MTSGDHISSNLDSSSTSREGGVDELLHRLASLSESEISEGSSSCNHPVSINLACIDCHQKVEEKDGNGLVFGYLHEGLRLSHSEIDRLRSVETKKLLDQKKLILVLDIDKTLLQSFRPRAFAQIGVAKDDESVAQIGGLFVKLRPFVLEFLERASTMFEMYLYTFGTRQYATEMAEILDPQGKYFSHRIISRWDNPGLAGIKTLDLVLGEKSHILILDDNDKVWPYHNQNLMLMKKYIFTGNKLRDETETNATLKKILEALFSIHTAYFNQVIQSTPPYEVDVRELAYGVRSKVLMGCKLYMINTMDWELMLMARELGAKCCKELDSSVTHLVSFNKEARVFSWGEKNKKHLVHPQWIYEAYYLWLRPPEENFPIKPENYFCTIPKKRKLLL